MEGKHPPRKNPPLNRRSPGQAPEFEKRGQKRKKGQFPPPGKREDRSPESLPNSEQAPEKHRKASYILLFAAIFLVAALVLYGLVRLCLLFVPISGISISGDSFYSAEELAAAAGIEEGGRMFGFSKSQAEARILAKYPYLESVRISRSLNGSLTFSAKKTESTFFIEVAGNYYALSRKDYCVLAEEETPDRFLAEGLYQVSLPGVRQAFLGQKLVFSAGKADDYPALLFDKLDASFLSGRITGIRASDAYAITVLVDGKYEILFGSIADFDRKLKLLSEMMAYEPFIGGSPVKADLSFFSSPTARPVEEIDQTIH